MAEQKVNEAHGLGHVGVKQMERNLCRWWHPDLRRMILEKARTCLICGAHNPKPAVKPEAGKFLMPERPGEEVVIDYTDMIDTGPGGVRYLLVCVDVLTGWPEAWATKREDAKSVIKCLINHYIPRHGFPKRIRSDNGTHFKNKDLQEVERMLGVQHKFGMVYHPQSQGKVERMNLNLKNKLAKICAQTGLNWVAALPIALMTIRCSVNQSTGFTPYELLTGRQFPAPWTVVPVEQPRTSNRSHAEYFNELKALVSSFTKQVTCERPTGNGEVPDAKAVWLKVIKRKWKEPRWTGPYEVTARTATAVQLKGKGDTWYHWSQCAPTHESLVEENSSSKNAGVKKQRQNKPSHLCNGPTSSPPGRPKKEEQPRRKSPRLQKGVIKWGGAFQDGDGSTVGEEVEQVNSFLSRAAITTKYMSKAGRTDMLSLLALGWNKRKVEQLGRTLSQRYLKIIRILREQVESLNASRNELGVDDDTLQQWAEETDQTDGSLGALQARVEQLVVIIRVRTQSLYRQNDSNKRRHRIRKVILDEKKRLAAAVNDYNKETSNKANRIQ
uniref:uncharacterized protein LOC112433120 n=1 Tax=Maylandia zebra TaxID=106582 RepID=UPI000D3264A6|nr:uncharacterized protein LOC112433120 [Maylandia zebra]